jgi:hypothetical protein
MSTLHSNFSYYFKPYLLLSHITTGLYQEAVTTTMPPTEYYNACGIMLNTDGNTKRHTRLYLLYCAVGDRRQLIHHTQNKIILLHNNNCHHGTEKNNPKTI